jgi:glycosyltransferase involved in cell wall biosynthesis
LADKVGPRKYLFIMANEGHRWGGSELLWSAAAEKLAQRGDKVRVSVKDWGEPVEQIEHLRSAGCQIFYRDLGPPPFIARQIRKLFPGHEYLPRHVRSVGDGIDLVVISQGAHTDGLGWMEAARAAGLNYAIIAQAAAEEWWPVDEIAERLAVCYENASAAYFVSEGNLALSRRQFGTPIPRGHVVRNPFNVRYDARPEWPTDSTQELALACIGRLEPKAKGQDLLLEVLALPHWRERRVGVSLVGTGVNERGLRGTIEKLQLSNVHLTGFVDDIEGLWSRHHALVLPSRYEGMPLALVEAMLCGRPCIVTDVAGHKELVRDGVNGFLAKAPAVELLDEAMNRAWHCRLRLKEMGETARADVRAWVSADPGEDFARELMALVDGKK